MARRTECLGTEAKESGVKESKEGPGVGQRKGTQVLFDKLEIIGELENSRARGLEDSLFWGLQKQMASGVRQKILTREAGWTGSNR